MARSPNGAGDSFALSIDFHPEDNLEDAKAWAAWQYLAGLRKGTDVLKGLLLFIHDHHERTGEWLAPDRIIAKFASGQLLGVEPPPGPALTLTVEPEFSEAIARRVTREVTAEQISAKMRAAKGSLSRLFGDDD